MNWTFISGHIKPDAIKRAFNLMCILICLIISCNTKDKSKIKISMRNSDYVIDKNGVKEENLSNQTWQNIFKKTGLDSSENLQKPLIDAMKNGDYMILLHHSIRCFSQENRSIILTKKDSVIYFVLPGRLIMQLTSDQIQGVRKLETQLSKIKNTKRFCTQSERYEFYLGKRLRTYIDNTCETSDVDAFESLINNFILLGINFKN